MNTSVIFQLHWQCIAEPEKTIWILQSETANHDDVHEWAAQQFQQRKDECPEGYQPLTCWGGSPYMVVGAE